MDFYILSGENDFLKTSRASDVYAICAKHASRVFCKLKLAFLCLFIKP